MRAVIRIALLTLLVAVLIPSYETSKEESNKDVEHTTIILIGATGDLSKKYLWKSFYALFTDRYLAGKRHFSFYGAGLSPIEQGRTKLSEILLNVVRCFDEKCRERKKKFIESTQYVQLKTREHYETIGKRITENIQTYYAIDDPERSVEFGRIIYMAIPPSAYRITAELANRYLRPTVGRPWFRVVLEKPFGRDLKSAERLSKDLASYFKEEEIYRIDHYLGKSISNLILPFRIIHKNSFESFWNNKFIERVEISSMEELDVKGRTQFYDEVGVFRDMFQNHLTELLVLIAMKLPKDSSSIKTLTESKYNVLKSINKIRKKHVVQGQYAQFNEQLINEKTRTAGNESSMPTFGSSVLYLNDPRWSGVPFILSSGKSFPEKSSYIRLIFKLNDACLVNDNLCGKRKEVIFYLGGSSILMPPCIIIGGDFPTIESSSKWKLEHVPGNWTFMGWNISSVQVLQPEEIRDAYTILVRALFDGNRHMFVDTPRLLESWKVWTPIIEEMEKELPRIYEKSKPKLVNLKLTPNGGLDYKYFPKIIKFNENDELDTNTFRNSLLIRRSHEELVLSLANDIEETMVERIDLTGAFHLVLSGGSSPIPLLEELSSRASLPWRQVHIWFADERCDESNFKMINENLLKNVAIDVANVHRVPIYLFDEEECFESARLYNELIKKNIRSGHFDYIVLGLGNDGHTASLFPFDNQSLDEREAYALFTNKGPVDGVQNRISLTFKAINLGRRVAVFVAGKSKREIMQKLKTDDMQILEKPIVGVQTNNLTWFVDNEAM
ncbi:DgyrCDS8349 [Dimorphilus gyrociliatus]|uniref:DgyrCDS8349 n=1 Tax=Dimorphilus gyrociliatus TaxID=2664684 RepID=A0A7I8VUV0_9ANNE|nr:DgyrCDS8349 [Dimorphilus gyrociliatus]